MKGIFKQIIIDFHGSIIPKPSHRDLKVTLSINSPKTEQRETEALQQAMEELNAKVGTIVTLDKKQELKIGRKTIYYIPLREFLLDKLEDLFGRLYGNI